MSFRNLIIVGVVAGLLGAGFHNHAQATTFTNGDFISYDQVNWASTSNAVAILADNYNTVFASSGGILEIGSSTGFTVEFSGASALAAYLPDGGPLGALDADLLDPTSTPAGAFGGNVTALVLDIDFSDAGVLRGNLGIPFGDLVLVNFGKTQHGVPGLNNLTVRQFSAVVNTVLGGGSYGSYTIADLNPVVVSITGSFDGNGTELAYATEHLSAPPAPPFQITSIVRTNATDLLITWNTSGATNIVQVTAGTGASGNFSTNGFTDLATIVVTTYTTNFWDVGAATNRPARYYRIRSPQ